MDSTQRMYDQEYLNPLLVLAGIRPKSQSKYRFLFIDLYI